MERDTEERSIKMKKRIPMFIALLLLATMVIISAVVPEPVTHDVEYPIANAEISWEQSFHSGAWNSAE